MPAKLNIILSLLAISVVTLQAQVIPPGKTDSIIATRPKLFATDSLSLSSIGPDTSNINWDSVKISPDAIEDKVDYHAKDSMFFDIKNKQIHLYGEAEVKYQTMTIQANYIVIDWTENTMTAEGKKAPLGEWIGKPRFQDGDQNFTASRMRYNFKTYKGIIFDAQTQQEGMNIVGEKAKFFGTGTDTTARNVIYNRNAIFSTCELEHPHFGIRSNKQKVVQNKVAVVGPSNLEVGGVPTPIWFPFGFFPLKIGQRTGLIFPQDYQYEAVHGFGLQGVGWYFPISDHVDLALTGDIYLKGSFRANAYSNYAKRYKYRGTASLSFAFLRSEVEGVSDFNSSMGLQWSHRQDQKAHPYRNFGGSINFQTDNHQKKNYNDAQSQLQTVLGSNMSYTQRFDAPVSLSASFSHSQNTLTRDMTIRFPVIDFQTQNLYPFKRKIASGKERWYEKISMRYVSKASNQLDTKDTTLFSQQTLDNAKFGAQHTLNTSTNFTVLKYFTFTPNANYDEVWYFKTVEKAFDPTLEIQYDTIYNPLDSTEPPQIIADTVSFGKVVEMDDFGFKPFRQYNMGVSMSTKIFGTLLFKRGKLKGLRHTITPNFGFNFSPDQTRPELGYFRTVQTTPDGGEILYSIFENNGLGFRVPSQSGRQMALTYGFGNQFEAKVFSKRDSTYKNVPVFRSLSINGQYNFAADSMKWSEVRVAGNTGFFNGITNFRFNATLSPYERNTKTGLNINKFYMDRTGKPLRLANYGFGFDSNLSVRRLRDLIKGVNTDVRVANQPQNQPEVGILEGQDFLSLFENFSIRHSFSVERTFNTTIGKDTFAISTNSIYSQGSIDLTPNWSVSVGNFGYDFQAKRITYPDFGFHRDLHCWEMGFFWRPLNDSYSFYIRVKPGKLDFINIPYRKGIQGGFGGGGFGGGGLGF